MINFLQNLLLASAKGVKARGVPCSLLERLVYGCELPTSCFTFGYQALTVFSKTSSLRGVREMTRRPRVFDEDNIKEKLGELGVSAHSVEPTVRSMRVVIPE